jgi:hypothetical protein
VDRRSSAWVVASIVLLGVQANVDARPADTAAERGIVKGFVGVRMFATTDAAGLTLADSRGFTVHLVPASRPELEIVEPAGAWFLPPEKDAYRWWIEGNGQISASGLIIFDFRTAGTADRGTPAGSPVKPAGTVSLDPGAPLAEGIALQLLDLDSGFARRAVGEAASRGVLMPAGRIVAALFDQAANEYSAVARPLVVAAGATVAVAPRPPSSPATDLVVRATIADRQVIAKGEAPALTAALPDGTRRPPDAVGMDDTNIHGFWYAVVARSVTVELSSKAYAAEPLQVSLPSGGVRSAVVRFRKLPTATVVLDLPSEFPREHAAMEVWRRGEVIRERPVGPRQDKLVLEALPAERLDLVLSSPPWRPREEFDLSDGQDRATVFRVEPIRIRGRVPVCGGGEGARLRFQNGQDVWAEFSTDPAGKFEFVAFQPLMMFEIAQPGRAGALPQILSEPIVSDREWNVSFPCNDYRVEVRDAETGESVPGAAVNVHNKAVDPAAGSSARRFQADANGKVRLPVLRAGTLTLRVEAEHYRKYRSDFDIPDRADDRTIDVRLQRDRAWGRVSVLLPDGRPAVGAAVAAMSLPSEAIVWEGTCGDDGSAELTLAPGATHLAVRHPAAGFSLTSWPTAGPSDPIVVQLSPQRALMVDTSGPGEPALNGTRIALWVGGVRLVGLPLAWLTQSNPGIDSTGVWRPCCVPASEIELLAWLPSRDLDARARSGSLDYLRTVVAPGSGPTVTVVPAH